MAFTDNCELYVAVHEDGINRIIGHMMRQRPSLFNYGTADIAGNRELWCEPVKYSGEVTKHGDPIFSIEQPIPVIGADSPPVGLSWCGQVPTAQIDFYPGKTISLPAELKPPLKQQHFALSLRACGGIGCPPVKNVDHIPVTTPHEGRQQKPFDLRGRPDCFCLDVFVIGHFEHAHILGRGCLLGKVDDVDIVDIKPDSLEDSIVCYLRTSLAVILREKLTIPLSTFAFSFPLFTWGTVTLAPTPNPPVPHNPAIEDEQLKVFISMTVI